MENVIWFILVILGSGLVATFFIFLIARSMVKNKQETISNEQLEKMIGYFEKVQMKSNPLWHLANAEAESLQRRNEFLATYTQTIVAVLLVIVLALLIISKIVEPQAGLPIISAISGYILAKGVSNKNSTGDGS